MSSLDAPRDQLMEALREIQVIAGLNDGRAPAVHISRPANRDGALAVLPGALGARAFKTIRGGSIPVEQGDAPRSICIGVVSPDFEDGKSTVAMALASCLAHDFVSEAMLVDADFETHSVGREYGLEGRPGLAEVLTGELPLQEVAYRYRGAPLTVVTSGAGGVDSSRLARSARLAPTISQMRQMAAFIVMDLPAGLRTSNAALLGQHCDGVIVVVRAGHTRQDELARLLRLLQDVNVIGVVINRHRSSIPAWAERALGLSA